MKLLLLLLPSLLLLHLAQLLAALESELTVVGRLLKTAINLLQLPRRLHSRLACTSGDRRSRGEAEEAFLSFSLPPSLSLSSWQLHLHLPKLCQRLLRYVSCILFAIFAKKRV